MLNVPVVKPLFIAVLDGVKALGSDEEIICHAGDFIFLSDSPAINMRNIPKDKEYFALLIEFEPDDFVAINTEINVNYGEILGKSEKFSVGKITVELEKCLQQFVEWSYYAPKSMWSLRKREILQLLYHLDHPEILAMAATHKLTHKLYALISKQPAKEMSLSALCQYVAMSESTLRRKLMAEGTSLQAIKDQVRLGNGLHLLQTTNHSIAFIAEQCGYQSQSRFSSRFKDRFSLTPSELRKTKLKD